MKLAMHPRDICYWSKPMLVGGGVWEPKDNVPGYVAMLDLEFL